MGETLQKKSVVTVFLLHGSKILICRRSEEVGTFRGKWAGISGYVEPAESPCQTALRELFEEAALTSGDVELVKRGRALLVPDRGEQTGSTEERIMWEVHPFLFRVRDPEKIRIDWEHKEIRWIYPRDVVRYDAVPMLPEALGRVYDYEVFGRIEDIRRDARHGASHLSRAALEVLKLVVERDRSKTRKEFETQFKQVGEELVESRPSMTSIRNLVCRVVAGALEEDEADLGALKKLLICEIEGLFRTSDLAVDKAAEYASGLIADSDKVMTCSYSATLVETFGRVEDQGKNVEVSVLERAPDGGLGYGEMMVDALKRKGVSAELVPFDALGDRVLEVNVVLVGADGVLPDGSLINGTPTHRLAVAAKERGLPFYAVCESSKFDAFDRKSGLEEGFDLVRAELVTRLVTEKGVIRPDEVADYAKEYKKCVERVFSPD